MYTPEEREKIRTELIQYASHDPRLSGGAITGSASVNRTDRWSDIDLAFGVRDPHSLQTVLEDHTQKMYKDHGALHHLDVVSGTWIYRVFFLANTLQVDLAFAPEKDFGARASTFKLLFGSSRDSYDQPTPMDVLVGWAWLYAIHGRSCIKRNQPLRAEYMITAMRNQVAALCCLHHQFPERQGRGLDQLPVHSKVGLEAGLVRSLQIEELERALHIMTETLIAEIRFFDLDLCIRLEPALRELAGI